MATLTVNDIVQTGLNTASVYVSAAGGGDVIPNNTGNTFLHVKNTDASSMTVTITSTATHSGLDVEDPQITVAATTGEQMIGPFPPGVYNNASGQVSISYSAVTSVTVAAFKLPV